MRKFCQTLDKQEKRYDIYSSIGYRCINKMSASKRKEKVNYTTLKVLRDTHYEYFISPARLRTLQQSFA